MSKNQEISFEALAATLKAAPPREDLFGGIANLNDYAAADLLASDVTSLTEADATYLTRHLPLDKALIAAVVVPETASEVVVERVQAEVEESRRAHFAFSLAMRRLQFMLLLRNKSSHSRQVPDDYRVLENGYCLHEFLRDPIDQMYRDSCEQINALIELNADILTALTGPQKKALAELYVSYYTLLTPDNTAQPILLDSAVPDDPGLMSDAYISHIRRLDGYRIFKNVPEIISRKLSFQWFMQVLQDHLFMLNQPAHVGLVPNNNCKRLAVFLFRFYDAVLEEKITLTVINIQRMYRFFLHVGRKLEIYDTLKAHQLAVIRRLYGLIATTPHSMPVERLADKAHPVTPVELASYSIMQCMMVAVQRYVGQSLVSDRVSASQTFFKACANEKGGYHTLLPVEQIKRYALYCLYDHLYLMGKNAMLINHGGATIQVSLDQFQSPAGYRLTDIVSVKAAYLGQPVEKLVLPTERILMLAYLDFTYFLTLVSRHSTDPGMAEFIAVLGNMIKPMAIDPGVMLSMAFFIAKSMLDLSRSLPKSGTLDGLKPAQKKRIGMGFRLVEGVAIASLDVALEAIFVLGMQHKSDAYYRYFTRDDDFIALMLGVAKEVSLLDLVRSFPAASKTDFVSTLVRDAVKGRFAKLLAYQEVVLTLAHDAKTAEALKGWVESEDKTSAILVALQAIMTPPKKKKRRKKKKKKGIKAFKSIHYSPLIRTWDQFTIYNQHKREFVVIGVDHWFYRYVCRILRVMSEQGVFLWLRGSTAYDESATMGDLDITLQIKPGMEPQLLLDRLLALTDSDKQLRSILSRSHSSKGSDPTVCVEHIGAQERFQLDIKIAPQTFGADFMSTSVTSVVVELGCEKGHLRLSDRIFASNGFRYPDDGAIYLYPKQQDRMQVARHYFRDLPFWLKTMVKVQQSVVGIHYLFERGMLHLLVASDPGALLKRSARFLRKSPYRHAGIYDLLLGYLKFFSIDSSKPVDAFSQLRRSGFCLIMLQTLYFSRTQDVRQLSGITAAVGLLRQATRPDPGLLDAAVWDLPSKENFAFER
jgi:hypothetical protein